jgi:hypothetical protein
MSITIFSRQPGVVASFNDPTIPASAALRMEGWGGFSSFKSIITRVSMSTQCNFQFLHTLGGNIYVYVFGDRVGQMSVSGLAFDGSCETGTNVVGIESVLAFYNANRLAARQTPMKITIGARTTLSTYLVGVNADLADANFRMWQFSLQFVVIPQSAIPCSAVDGVAASPSTTPETTPSDSPGTFPAPDNPQVAPGGNYTDIGLVRSNATGYSSTGAGPNLNMVKAQVQ